MFRFVCSVRENLLLMLMLISAATPAIQAQTSGSLAETPIVIMRNDGINTRTMVEYVESVSSALQIGSNLQKMMQREDVQSMLTEHPDPASGSLVYMVQGLIPAIEQIEFTEVVDEAEFGRLVRAQTSRFGDNGELTGSGDRFKHVFSNSWRVDIPDDEETTEATVQVGVSVGTQNGIQVNTGTSQDSQIIEENGRRFREHSFTITRFYRFHDGFMFTSSYEDLFTTPLPTRETLLGGSKAEHDAEVQFYPDRIPVGFKHLFWGTINASASAELQQRDEEEEVDYNVRRTGGDLALSTIHTLLFDTEFVTGSLQLATESLPIRGELKLASRDHSKFSETLREVSSTAARFAPVLNDDAAATVHLSVKLPDSSRRFLTSLGEWIRVRLSDAAGRDIDLAIAGSEIEETLEGVAAHGNLEAFLKIGWSAESDGVIYGGLQVDDNPHLLRNLYHLLSNDDTPIHIRDQITIVQQGDRELIEFSIPAVPADMPVKATHIYLCHAESCLWFACGSENSWKILQRSLERCESAAGLSMRTPLFTADVDLQRWMSYPQDDPTGIAGLPTWGDRFIFDQRARAVTARRLTASGSIEDLKPAPNQSPVDLMQRVIDLGGSQSASLELSADQSGVVLRGELGAVIGRYAVAQWLSMMDSLVTPMLDLEEGENEEASATASPQEGQ